jgi:hypothetical protein
MIQAARPDLCPNNLNIALASHFLAYERPNMQYASSSFVSIILAPSQTPRYAKTYPSMFLFPKFLHFPTAPSANRYPRSLREHSSCDIHCRQLLEEQLGCIWNMNLRDLGLVLARSTLEGLIGEFAGSRSVQSHSVILGTKLTQSVS